MERVRGRKEEDPLAPLVGHVDGWLAARRRVVAACPSHEQAERLSFLLGERGIKCTRGVDDGAVRMVAGRLSAGMTAPGIAIITEEDVFGERARRSAPRMGLRAAAASLMELREGDHVVHTQFGIGIYRGLVRMALWGVENDFLAIEYRDAAKLYLPVQRLNLVKKYRVPEGGEPRLDRLGGNGWEKTRARVKDSLLGMASELLRLHALRKSEGGTAYPPPDDYYTEFCASFEFEETPDQQKAIDEVMGDMQKPVPMDRLVCGDVGYGKTEVAIRAAFKAVQEGRQVAVLVPTTVLAQQHYRTFRRRFDRFPVKVALLSRFVGPDDQKRTIAGLESGAVDVLIGTHKALQKGIRWKSLGLLIIDEEHRFGVAHKERIKKLMAGVDILTLTATPIPRTLHMALGGLKDLSIITTPPQDRLAVRTFVMKFDQTAIREAIERELHRGGQVFFVHDRVQSLGGMKMFLDRLLPGARIGVAHGQMEADALEKAMVDFIEHRVDILLSTTIIGAGLDIPSANTMLINRADMLGLSQLYQLRGRVGRGRERAYCYLFTPTGRGLTSDARKRLETMYEFQALGSGFNVAMQDLELRGAGNLLGKAQHGQVAAVGFDLYSELLEEAVAELRGRPPGEAVDPEVKLPVPSYIPEKYIGDVPLRLDYYQKMVYARSGGDVAAVVEEMEDRYGRAPDEVHNLADVMSLTVDLRALDAESLEYGKGNVVLGFSQNAGVDPQKVVAWVQKNQKTTRLTTDGRLIFAIGEVGLRDLVRTIHAWVKKLADAVGK
jgi:transcription-repair coupling factor (superfamily II helicase)